MRGVIMAVGKEKQHFFTFTMEGRAIYGMILFIGA